MSLRDDINIPLIVVLGIITGLIVAVAIVGTKAGYNYVQQVDLARNYDYAAGKDLIHFGQQIMDQQQAALAQPAAWSNVDKSTVRIPIDRALTIMVESKGKTRPAAPPATQPAGR